jgi:hypothetical protein
MELDVEQSRSGRRKPDSPRESCSTMAIERDGPDEQQTKKPADELAASLWRSEQAERTLRVVEPTKDQLGVVYGELERVVQHLGEERARLEKLLRSRAGRVIGGD